MVTLNGKKTTCRAKAISLISKCLESVNEVFEDDEESARLTRDERAAIHYYLDKVRRQYKTVKE